MKATPPRRFVSVRPIGTIGLLVAIKRSGKYSCRRLKQYIESVNTGVKPSYTAFSIKLAASRILKPLFGHSIYYTSHGLNKAN